MITSCNSSNKNSPAETPNENPTTHTHYFGEWEVIKEPTVTETGEKIRYCSCGETQTGIIAKLNAEEEPTTDAASAEETTTEEVTTEEITTEEQTTEEVTTEEQTTEEQTTEEQTTEEQTTEEQTTEEQTTEEQTTEEQTTEEQTTEEQTTEEQTTAPEGEENKVSVSISDTNWSDSTKYTSLKLNSTITASVSGGQHTGKYYASDDSWRLYQNEQAKITISASNGQTIKSVKITYISNNSGRLVLNGSIINSGATVNVNASKVTFSVGNAGSGSNGQARITNIEIVYLSQGGNTGGDDVGGGNTDDVPTGTPTSSRKHFTDSLDTNGPLTEGCLPSSGSPKVLVVPVNLDSSNASNKMLENIEIAFNGTQAQTGWYSVTEYYSVSSYGKLNLDFDVLDEWFTPSRNKSYYGSYDSDGYYGSTLILDEILEYYDDEIDFSDYDSNSDGYIDAIWLIYNCPVDYEGDSDYWAYVYWTPSEIEVDGVYACYYGFAGTDFMFEETDYSENINVDAHTYIHETGHLMGLDDYYDYNENEGAEGGFYWADMMDGNIGDHASINKLLLGWIDPIVVSGKGSITIDLNSFAKTGDAILISNHSVNSIYDEYFLIEFYTPDLLNENDQPIYPAYYGDEAYGIRVLHIDAHICYDRYGEVTFNNDNGYVTGFLYDNSDEEKLFVDTLYCELTDEYATSEILFTDTSASFASKYSIYRYHDGSSINFDFVVNAMDGDSASSTITVT